MAWDDSVAGQDDDGSAADLRHLTPPHVPSRDEWAGAGKHRELVLQREMPCPRLARMARLLLLATLIKTRG